MNSSVFQFTSFEIKKNWLVVFSITALVFGTANQSKNHCIGNFKSSYTWKIVQVLGNLYFVLKTLRLKGLKRALDANECKLGTVISRFNF